MEISSKSIFWVREQNSIVWPLYKSLNRVNPQSSNGLRFNRQSLQTVIFYRQPSKMYSNINRQRVRYWNLTISADLPWRASGSRRIFEVEKPRAKFSKIGFLNISTRVAQERFFLTSNFFFLRIFLTSKFLAIKFLEKRKRFQILTRVALYEICIFQNSNDWHISSHTRIRDAFKYVMQE